MRLTFLAVAGIVAVSLLFSGARAQQCAHMSNAYTTSACSTGTNASESFAQCNICQPVSASMALSFGCTNTSFTIRVCTDVACRTCGAMSTFTAGKCQAVSPFPGFNKFIGFVPCPANNGGNGGNGTNNNGGNGTQPPQPTTGGNGSGIPPKPSTSPNGPTQPPGPTSVTYWCVNASSYSSKTACTGTVVPLPLTVCNACSASPAGGFQYLACDRAGSVTVKANCTTGCASCSYNMGFNFGDCMAGPAQSYIKVNKLQAC